MKSKIATKLPDSKLPDSNGGYGRQWLFLGLILLLAAALYLYKIDWKGLWIDEFISLIDAQKLRLKDGRFLYYPLLSLWMMFGQSDAWLRGLSVIFALGSVWLLYELGRYLLGETTGLVAALMLALSPYLLKKPGVTRRENLGQT